MRWPMPAPPHGYIGWEFWRVGRPVRSFLIPKMTDVLLGNIELTQEIWEELPEEVQEGFFKLGLLKHGCAIEGVGQNDIGGWLELDAKLTPRIVAGRPFGNWYKNLKRIKERDNVQQHNK